MNLWQPLWNTIVESSLWDEDDYVVKVFLTMLAVQDVDHIVRHNAYALSRKSRKTEAQVLEALKILSEPDEKRLEPQEFDGRRIKAVEEGWLILNGAKYQEMVKAEMRRANNRKSQAAFRKRQEERRLRELANSAPTHSGAERAFVKSIENGEPVEKQDSIVEQTLPEKDNDVPS
jgi:hypothetical protein